MADPGGGRSAAGPAVHLLEPPGYHGRHVRRIDQRRPQLLARNPDRRHSARPQPAGRQQQRDVAAHRDGRASSSSRPARSAPNSAVARRRSRTSSSSPGTNDFHGSGAFYLQDSSMDARPVPVAKALGQNSGTGAAELGGRRGRPDHAAEDTAARTAASSMPRSRGPTRKTRHRPHSVRCRRASSRTATFRVCSMRATRAMPVPGRPSELMPSGARTIRSDLRSAHHARRRRPGDPRSVPQQCHPARDVGRRGAQHPRAGTVGCAGAGSPVEQPAGAATSSPVFDQKTFATKYDQVLNDKHKLSFFINREWRERNNSPAGRYGLPPGSPTNLYQFQSTPSWMIRATENWVISDRFLHRFAFGYNRFGNANRSVHFNAGWPSKIGLTNQPDTTFPRFAFTRDGAILRIDSGQLRIDSTATRATRAARSSRTI